MIGQQCVRPRRPGGWMLRGLGAGLVAALLAAGCEREATTTGAPPSAADTPPNVIVLFADDLGYGDLGSYGHPYNRTPHLDRLAAEGQRWTDFYVPAPVCSPSRGALLTGQYPNRSGLYGRRLNVLFPDDPGGMPAGSVTLAERLRDVGYRTAIIGKWHLGDAPDALPTRHGFERWFGLPYSNDMDWARGPDFDALLGMIGAGQGAAVQAEFAARRALYFEPRIEYWQVPLMRSRIDADGGYVDEVVERPAVQPTLTRRYTEEAERFIDAHRDEPFFLYLPYTMPHTPLFASGDFAGVSPGGLYGDVIEEIDWSVGRIRAALEDRGLAERTLVVFTSDNGPWLAMRHHGGSAGLLSNGKGTTFEGGMRVPAIFWWPGTIEPGVVRGLGATLDLMPTVTALAGAPAADGLDGVDLGATLTAGADSPRTGLAYYRSGELQAYRLGRYKLRLISAGAYDLPPARTEHETPQLFDLHADPAEAYDIAAEHPEVVAEIEAAIADHRAALEDAPPLFDRRLGAGGGR